jgi:hypothetical protein
MGWLTKNAKPGDSLFFHCRRHLHVLCSFDSIEVFHLDSGHGEQVDDLDGDESDEEDEGSVSG